MENEENRRNSEKEIILQNKNQKNRRKSDTWIKYYHREDRDLLCSDSNNDNGESDVYRGSSVDSVSSSSIFLRSSSYQSSTTATMSSGCELLVGGGAQSFNQTQNKAKTFVSSVCRLYSGNLCLFFCLYFRIFLVAQLLYNYKCLPVRHRV